MVPSRAIPTRRAGVTLIELLVVISILLVLAVMLARVLPGVLEGRRTREAARLVNVFLGTARGRAVELGRPVGVIFFRDPSLPQACVKLQQAESPPPYAGDFQDSRIVCTPGVGGVLVSFSRSERPFADGDGIVREGDQLQLNYQGHVWTIMTIGAGPQPNTWLLTFSSPTASQPPATAIAVPFQFIRQPVPSSVPPVTLPERTVVDLFGSGTDQPPYLQFKVSGPWAGPPGDRIMMMFSPNGTVDGYYYPFGTDYYHPCVGPVFFLVGRRDRVTLDPTGPGYPSPAEDTLLNYFDTNSLWVAVNPQTGMVVTTEVTSAPDLLQARRYAREAQRMGGQ